jgi:ubiquinone/menaquinone biosynthesis C-methylase UbiE
MSLSRGRNQGWRNYWKEDRLNSCVPENNKTAREIGEHWIGLFAVSPDSSRILDVATGNGALLAHAAQAAEQTGKSFSMTGIDLADIDPVRYVSDLPGGLRNANFIGGVAAEKLPFPDSAFDIVASQYGLEYAALDKALGEVERVLVVGGRLLWLAHSAESSVVEQNRDQSQQVEFLLEPGSPIHAMRLFVAKIRKRKGLQYATQKLSSALSEADLYCRENPPANVIREVCTVLAETAQRWQTYHVDDLDKMLNDSQKRLIAHRQRINDLLAAVISPARENLIRSRLQQRCWEAASFSTMRVGSASSPIGILIEARRAE